MLLLASAADVASAGENGAVTVTRTGTTVRVTGGAGNERIVIEPGDAAGELRIRNDGSTTVNDGQETVIGVGAKDKVLVSLGANADSVVVQGVLPKFRALAIDTGEGDDRVTFLVATVPAPATVVDPNGSNTLEASRSQFGKGLLIAGGDGNDTISVSATEVARNLEIRAGAGVVNLVTLNAATIGGKTKVTGTAGFLNCDADAMTFRKTVLFDCGDADAYFGMLRSTAEKNLKVKGQDGAATVEFFDTDVGGPVSISAGEGDDRADFVLARFSRPSKVNLGGGNDQARLGDIAFTGKFKLIAGDGDDTVFSNDTVGSTSSKPVILDGGAGTDLESGSLGLTGGGRLIVKNFENTPE